MKIKAIIISAVAVVFAAGLAFAQGNPAHHPQRPQMRADTTRTGGMMKGGMMGGSGMMQGGMMGKMGMMHGGMMGQGRMGGMMGHMGMMMQGEMGMSDPMHRFFKVVHHLPDLAGKFNLTDDQKLKLDEIRADFLKRQADWKAALEKSRIDLKLLLEKKASAKEIQRNLQSYYRTKVEMQLAAYQTAAKMKALLTPDQRKQLESWLSGKCPNCMGMGKMGSGMMGHGMGKK